MARFVPRFMIEAVATVTVLPIEAEPTAVLFADLTGFAALTEARGDSAAADVATRFAGLARQSLALGTRLLKTLGAGVLVVGPDLAAARATAEQLRELMRREPALPPVRAGICHGAVVWRDGDVFGATVNHASRLADSAEPWEIREWRLPTAEAPGQP